MAVAVSVEKRGAVPGQGLCVVPRVRLIITEDEEGSSLPWERGEGEGRTIPSNTVHCQVCTYVLVHMYVRTQCAAGGIGEDFVLLHIYSTVPLTNPLSELCHISNLH